MVLRPDLTVLSRVTRGGGRVPEGGATDVIGRVGDSVGLFSFCDD